MSRFTHINTKNSPMKTTARPIFVPSTPRHTPVWSDDWNQR